MVPDQPGRTLPLPLPLRLPLILPLILTLALTLTLTLTLTLALPYTRFQTSQEKEAAAKRSKHEVG